MVSDVNLHPYTVVFLGVCKLFLGGAVQVDPRLKGPGFEL